MEGLLRAMWNSMIHKVASVKLLLPIAKSRIFLSISQTSDMLLMHRQSLAL